MAITYDKQIQIGVVGAPLSQWLIYTTDTLATVTTTGYLTNLSNAKNYNFTNADVATVFVTDAKTSGGSVNLQVAVSSDGQTVSLVEPTNTGGVTLPVVSGDFAVFDGTSGVIKDSGYLPTNAAKTKVVMASAAVLANHIACFSDTSGTVNDDASIAINGGDIQAGLSGTAGAIASFPATAAKGSLKLAAVANTGDTLTTISNAAMGQASVVSIPDPGAATSSFVLTSSAASTQSISTGVNITGGANNLQVVAGNVFAGSSGAAGILASYPTTASKGSLVLSAIDNTGNTDVTISNALHGQASVYSIPDVGAATGQFNVVTGALVSGNSLVASGTAGKLADAGYSIKTVAGAVAAGGNAAQSFTDEFCTSGSNVIGNWNTQTNPASVQKIVPGDGSFVVTSSADAGSGTFNYFITK